MTRYRDQVTAAVGSVTIHSPTGYAWLGRPSRPLPASLLAQIDQLERRRHLAGRLREELYSSFYCTGVPVPTRLGNAEPVAADPWLTMALSDANTGRGSWQPGWIVHSCDGDAVVVSTHRLRVRVPSADCRADGDGPIRSGVAVSVRLPKELPARSPGFFTVLGEAVFESTPSTGILRVYWDVGASGAPALVRALSSRLNAEEVPFRLKVADHPVRFDRCDAAVLYLPSEAFSGVRGMLAQVAATLASHLRPEIPAFTLAFAAGVGLAESTNTGESFGEHRCGLLADGIVDAAAQGVTPGPARVEAVIASLAAHGVMIDAPYLEPSLDGQHVL